MGRGFSPSLLVAEDIVTLLDTSWASCCQKSPLSKDLNPWFWMWVWLAGRPENFLGSSARSGGASRAGTVPRGNSAGGSAWPFLQGLRKRTGEWQGPEQRDLEALGHWSRWGLTPGHLSQEIFGPLLTVYVYPDDKYKETLRLVDSTTSYGLTGAVFAQDK